MKSVYPIRILIFFPNLFSLGGIENYIMNFHRYIDKNMIQFDYIFPLGKGMYEDEIISLGGNIFHIDMENKSVGFFKKLFKSFLKKGYSTVHFHSDNFAMKAMLGAKLSGIKNIIIQSHNNSNSSESRFKSKIKNYLISLISKNRLAVSNESGRWLFGKKSYVLMHAGINPDNFLFDCVKRDTIRKQLNIGKDEIVIGCVGHLLERHKNQSFLFDVLKQIQRSHKNTKLVLVGGGEDEEMMKSKATDSGVSGIVFAGKVNAQDYYNCFDVFSLPSFHEGLPISCIEAIVNGLNCLVSDNVPITLGLEKFEKQLPLSCSKDIWGEEMIKLANSRKFTCPQEFYDSPYLLKNAVKKMQDFYLSLYE